MRNSDYVFQWQGGKFLFNIVFLGICKLHQKMYMKKKGSIINVKLKTRNSIPELEFFLYISLLKIFANVINSEIFYSQLET